MKKNIIGLANQNYRFVSRQKLPYVWQNFLTLRKNIAKQGKIHIQQVMKGNSVPSLWATLALDTFMCVWPPRNLKWKKFFYSFPDKAGIKRSRNFEKKKIALYKGWNFNSGNYLFTTDTK